MHPRTAEVRSGTSRLQAPMARGDPGHLVQRRIVATDSARRVRVQNLQTLSDGRTISNRQVAECTGRSVVTACRRLAPRILLSGCSIPARRSR